MLTVFACCLYAQQLSTHACSTSSSTQVKIIQAHPRLADKLLPASHSALAGPTWSLLIAVI